MNAREKFDTYRRMFATPEDSVVCWWYTGMSYVGLPEHPDIPISQVAAIMTFRTESVSADVFRIHWSEIGVFTNAVTGEVPSTWTNPVTGALVDVPKSFFEGPGVYTVRADEDGVRLDVEQPGARIHELRVDFRRSGDRVAFVQLERKQRGYPRPDGTLPSLAHQPGLDALTELEFFTSASELAKPPGEELRVQGTYRFTLSGIPAWLGFGDLPGYTRTLGSITRARPGERVNAQAWRMLEERFPTEITDPPATRRTPAARLESSGK